MKEYCDQHSANCEKISHMQKTIEKHDDRIDEIEKKQVKTDTILEQSIVTNKELSTVMKQVSTTMIEIQHSLTTNSNEICEINQKLTNLNNKVDCESDKNKIDIRDIGKNGINTIISHLLKGLLVIGAGYGLFDIIRSVIEKVG